MTAGVNHVRSWCHTNPTQKRSKKQPETNHKETKKKQAEDHKKKAIEQVSEAKQAITPEQKVLVQQSETPRQIAEIPKPTAAAVVAALRAQPKKKKHKKNKSKITHLETKSEASNAVWAQSILASAAIPRVRPLEQAVPQAVQTKIEDHEAKSNSSLEVKMSLKQNEIRFPGSDVVKLINEDPILILDAIFEESRNHLLKEEDREALRKALPALEKMVAEKPEDLLMPLMNNFESGTAVKNFELMNSYGVFDILFPPVLHDKFKEGLKRYLAQMDAQSLTGTKPSFTLFLCELLHFHMMSALRDKTYDSNYTVEENIDWIMADFPVIACLRSEVKSYIREQEIPRLKQFLLTIQQMSTASAVYPQQPTFFMIPQQSAPGVLYMIAPASVSSQATTGAPQPYSPGFPFMFYQQPPTPAQTASTTVASTASQIAMPG